MANYTGAAEGLDDLVRRRTLRANGITDQQETDPFANTGPVTGVSGPPEILPGTTGTGSQDGLPYTPTTGTGSQDVPFQASGGGGFQPSTVNTSVQTSGSGALSDAFTQTLMSHLNWPIGASLSDPALAAQSNAYGVGQQRARDQARESLAERMAAQGIGSSGAMDSGIERLYQRQGENQATFDANLVGDELNRQRQELLSYAQMAGSRLSDQERNALTARLGEIDAELRKQGINNQAAQYDSSMGWNQAIWNYLQNQAPWGAAGVPGQ